MTSSVESKSFRMERLLRDSQNIQTTTMGENKKANGNVTKGVGQKRKAMTMNDGIETKRQAMEQSKANRAPNAQPIQLASSNPSATVSTAPIPPKVPAPSTFPKLPMASIFQHQPFPPFLPPPFAFSPHFYSTPPIRGATQQQFPTPAIPNPFLVAAILHQQQIAQQQQQAQATAAFLQQMFMMSPMSNLSAAGTPGSSNVGSSGGNNSSAGGSLGRGNGGGGNGNPGMAFRIPQKGQMNLAANAMENRDKLIGNEAMAAANLETPKNVQQRGKRAVKVEGQNAMKKEEVVATCEFCGKTFERYWLLNGHIRTHTGDKPFECNWPGCGKKFADRSNCRAHERTHRPEKPFACPTCPKSFKLKSYLTKHVRAKVCNPGAKMMQGNEKEEERGMV